ncbi:ribosomal maturation YjgA family protein [Halpernia frigidisoli]|uniref:DUF2809 domain-containing protein n=1 Tax=Halpernia frigidisoli TaxID=1125876 RepID=A0A1I3GV69_9FLAO|nr:DUF2809 domain-containing protein [Halpernia frigidisoli]SFI27465.1 Protein of unknown function [Halpernia frigidisoli]
MRFDLKYFILTISLFMSEVLIATVFKNIFLLRAYFGDVLVVILMYTFILTFFKLNKTKLVCWIFVFACLIEFLQYYHFAEILGFNNNVIAMIVLGNSFSWIDMICYAIGSLSTWLIDIKLNKIK